MDIDFKELKRGPQVVLPKDTGLILAYSKVSKESKVLDAGTGSGWLAIFLAKFVREVHTYEKRKEFYKLAKKNIKSSNLDNIRIFNEDIKEVKIDGEFDLITLDFKKSFELIKRLDKNLRSGGTFVIYSPNIEQVKEAISIFEELRYETRVIENIVREWKVGFSTHPINSGILHTGFLCFGYKK